MIGTTFDNWQASPPPARHEQCSPNLLLVLDELRRRWPPMGNLGCFGHRPVRGSTTVASSHSFGAAIDVGYPGEFDGVIAAEVCGFLVGRSSELHVSAVHDYRRCRIWRAGRTSNVDDACSLWWKAQRSSSTTGMGQPWANHLHLEVTAIGWGCQQPIGERWAELPDSVGT